MSVSGYETGPIACPAAFVADFDIAKDIPMEQVVVQMDSDRRTMAARAGMRCKYVPLRFDPATGAHQIGGRYLFDTWDDLNEYVRFTTEELEFEPGIKFWDRPFFSSVDKRVWHVVGAHDFIPLDSHYASRFEQFEYQAGRSAPDLSTSWAAVRDAARDEGNAGVWLLIQPEKCRVGLLTVVSKGPGNNEMERASSTLATLEGKTSLVCHLSSAASLRPLSNRSSLHLSLWLPRSESTGGEASIFPTYPVHPRP